MFLRQPIIADDYFMIITIIGPTINRSDASPKSMAGRCWLLKATQDILGKIIYTASRKSYKVPPWRPSCLIQCKLSCGSKIWAFPAQQSSSQALHVQLQCLQSSRQPAFLLLRKWNFGSHWWSRIVFEVQWRDSSMAPDEDKAFPLRVNCRHMWRKFYVLPIFLYSPSD